MGRSRGGALTGSEAFRVHLRRTGGMVAGNVVDASVGPADLGPEDARAVEDVLRGEALRALAGRPPAPPAGADAYQYEIAARVGDAEVVARCSADQVPEEVWPLIDAVERAAGAA
jgi:hypothetical protein